MNAIRAFYYSDVTHSLYFSTEAMIWFERVTSFNGIHLCPNEFDRWRTHFLYFGGEINIWLKIDYAKTNKQFATTIIQVILRTMKYHTNLTRLFFHVTVLRLCISLCAGRLTWTKLLVWINFYASHRFCQTQTHFSFLAFALIRKWIFAERNQWNVLSELKEKLEKDRAKQWMW